MSLEELKDLLIKLGQGRRDSAEQLAELLHEMGTALDHLSKPAEKPKKAAK